jgi:hypothetical protein
MKWGDILTIAGGLILLGMFLTGIWEVIALINLRLPFTPDFPPITWLVRPWIANNKDFALGLAAAAFASQFWLFFHFFLNL